MKFKKRIDLLTKQAYPEYSIEYIQKMILSGNVLVNDEVIDKVGYLINIKKSYVIRIKTKESKFVSRAGEKLDFARKKFCINFQDMLVLDVGASTGGFTHCALLNGALKVYALDVGTNQLDYKIRTNNKVVVLEQTNFRTVDSKIFPSKFDVICMDVSFISTSLLIANVKKNLNNSGKFICLIKPQFEATKIEVLKHNAIITDSKIHYRVLNEFQENLNKLDLYVNNCVFSPIKGRSGNIEFLCLCSFEKNYYDFKEVL